MHVARLNDKSEGSPNPLGTWYNPSQRRDIRSQVFSRETSNLTSDLIYKEPIHYPVTKTGFYCVGKSTPVVNHRCWCRNALLAAIPVTVSHLSTRADTDVPFHPSYSGKVLFQNVFKGQLPATDYPKVNVSSLTRINLHHLLSFLVLLCDVPCLCCYWGCLGVVLLSSSSRFITDSGKF